MREQEALDYLDRALPPEVAFTLNHVSWASAAVDFRGDAPVRTKPLAYRRSREWAVSVSHGGDDGDYLEVTMERSLSRAVKGAVAKFLAWRLGHARAGSAA